MKILLSLLTLIGINYEFSSNNKTLSKLSVRTDKKLYIRDNHRITLQTQGNSRNK